MNADKGNELCKFVFHFVAINGLKLGSQIIFGRN
jgi:hypothetical protein